MKHFLTAAAVVGAALVPAGLASAAGRGSEQGNGSGGVTGPAFYVDGELYRTVGTQTDFTATGAPAHSYDTIYAIDGQPNVATAAPGDAGYNGGRWMVLPVTIDDAAAVAPFDTNGSGDLDSDEELLAAVAAGVATIGDPIASFLCPVIPVPGH